jgi:hypothetical protein
MSLSRIGLLLDSRTGDRLAPSTSELSALLSLVSVGEETEEVLRLLLAGAYLWSERRRFRSLSPPLLLRLLGGLRRRRLGGVKLSRLLLRVSRRSSRSRPLRALTPVLIMSLFSGPGDNVLLSRRVATRSCELWLEGDRDLDTEDVFLLLRCRDFGGGDGLMDFEGLLLRLRVV